MKAILFQVVLFFFLITITIGLFQFIANPVIVVTVLVLEVTVQFDFHLGNFFWHALFFVGKNIFN